MPAPKPIVFTPEEVETVRKLSGMLSSQQIADYFEISVDTFERIRKRQPEVETAYKRGRAELVGRVAQNGIIGPALSGNTTAAIFYLKTQAGWREVERVSSDVLKEAGVLVVNKPANSLENVTELLSAKRKPANKN